MSKEYAGKAIAVSFDARRCAHTAVCLRSSPAVFDLKARPWISVDAASADEVAATVSRCPTGALQFRRLDGGPDEEVVSPVQLLPVKDGPLLLRGSLELAGDPPVQIGPRAALCRCGASANKPFCDSSHRKIGFKSDP